MGKLMALSIITGVLCGIWAQLSIPMSISIELMTWAGFAGCTTYFASGKHGAEGFFVTVRQNMFGVLSGLAIIYLCGVFSFPGALGLFSGGVTFIMCIAGKYKYLAFIPGTFVGCFSTFAANGNYAGLVFSLLIGAVLGVACDLGGGLFHTKFGKAEASEH